MSVSFVTRLHKASKNKSNQHPIVLQITWGTNVRRKRLGINATLEEWSFDSHEFKKGVEERKEKNDLLEATEQKAFKIHQEHFTDKPFNYKKFVNFFEDDKKKRKPATVIEFCLEVSAKFLQNQQANSSNDYKYLANAIRKISPNDLTFDEFTEDWLYEFEEYFTSKGTKCVNYMRHLKALYNKAVQKKVADFTKHPFKNPYTNPYGYDASRLKKQRFSKASPFRIKDLCKENLLKLMDYKPRTENDKKYLSIWFFSYYMFGVNLTDVANLKRSDIRNNRWYYQRSKTGTGLKKGKPILPEAMKIIELYDTKKEYVFDILNGYDTDALTKANRIKDYSKYIWNMCRKASQELGFDGHFTYYSARYTSATIALNEGADKNTVSHLLDHENLSTIDNYAGRADDSKVLEAMEILRMK